MMNLDAMEDSQGLEVVGAQEAEAWADAVRKIEQREGRRMPG